MLTHIARNADSVVWRLEGAARGELRDQYPGGLEQRKADIEAGAGRPAAELVRRRAPDLGGGRAAVMAGLPRRRGTPRRARRGAWSRAPATRVLSRWREVVVHHGDLGLGPVPFPPELVDAWLPQELPRLAQRTDPARLLSWIIGRGDPPVLAAW